MTGQERAWGRAGLVLLVVLALDQLTKALVRGAIEPGDERGIIGPIDLVHVRNEGVAFGALAGGGIIVVVLVAIALTALVIYFATHAATPLAWLPTGMLLGGALGNVIDRIHQGAVTDFVKLPHWPAFNVADVSITFGVLVLLWVIERHAPDRRAA